MDYPKCQLCVDGSSRAVAVSRYAAHLCTYRQTTNASNSSAGGKNRCEDDQIQQYYHAFMLFANFANGLQQRRSCASPISLWFHAYEQLRSDKPKLVRKFEKMLLSEVKDSSKSPLPSRRFCIKASTHRATQHSVFWRRPIPEYLSVPRVQGCTQGTGTYRRIPRTHI